MQYFNIKIKFKIKTLEKINNVGYRAIFICILFKPEISIINYLLGE